MYLFILWFGIEPSEVEATGSEVQGQPKLFTEEPGLQETMSK